ncbi:MAG: carbon-nitrogen hydrolase family protein [Gammaproteobacteria bacterium]
MSSLSRIACIQMTSTEDVSRNLLSAQELIRNAVDQGAKLLVLPENFALMGLDQTDKVKHREEFNNGPIQEFLRKQAQTHDVWIVGGTIPIAVPEETNRVFASSLVYNSQGECVARYDKIHLFDVQLRATNETYLESRTVMPGDRIVVVDTPFGKLGLAVCYDVRFPEMFRLMLKQNVELIALPSAFTYTTGAAHWEVLARARAIENLSFVLAACQTGAHTNTRKTYGHSMIVNPWGEVQVCLPEGEGVVVSEINLEFLQRIRQDFPALDHRKKI